ncbi:hypothetical protein Pme01_05720 [Planosporangium mesophilum]|uniref:DUF2334 domain-containing protein n=2 Tax=Planosporangium mesophilum TaxID=689768 RepID=A0A8J3WY72_9ACTN|nr:DUF2334 domain-containing protein [Planosporangium mesophilum]GII20975.1 hypothetical protein Pme01_05720 [Planosporangium mesophilum]
MRRYTGSRRAAIGSLIALALAATVTTTPAQAAERPTKRTVTKSAAGRGPADGAAATKRLPAPPRPSKLRPSQRVVAGSTAPAKAQPGAAAAIGKSGAGAPGAGTGTTLIVYDNTGPYAWLGETYAIQTANLVSHFGAWTAHPVGQYTAGELSRYTSVVYVGSTYDEPVPVAFLDDVTATQVPVLWLYDNIWQLTARDPNFVAKRGFTWTQFDTSTVSEVDYKGTAFTRDTLNQGGIMDHVIYDAAKASTVATAVRADGTTFPWAVRSGNFTYVGEIPFSYVSHDDRYVAFSDLLFDVLAPNTATRHRALVRIEDVGPDADPAELRAVADYLYSRKVPFSVAVYSRYRDPKGVNNNGRPEDYTLAQRPKVVSALRYMQSRGGTLLMHGYTHQYGNTANPYDGVSANDFEFYRAHVDAADNVVYDGPVAEDSTTWVNNRISAARTDFRLAGLSVPTVFEPPHYAASATDYQAFNSQFGKRYDRGLYFPGALTGAKADHTRMSGQFFPYAVRDVYGSAIAPENLGNVEPVAFNHHPPRLPADILASAKRNLVVRDGSASFFYHPYLGTDYLKATVEGVQGLGYTFVPASALLG